MTLRAPFRTLTVTAVLAGALAAPPAQAADVPSTRLYFHSATGSYAQDAAGTSPYSAPARSALTAALPARSKSARAVSAGSPVPGAPQTPTWSLPFKGTVKSICFDLFVQTTAIAFVPPGVNKAMYTNGRFSYGGATGPVHVASFTRNDFPSGIVRVTQFVALPAPVDLPEAAMVSLNSLAANNPDWTLLYDSANHFSSVSFNSSKAACTEAKLPAPKVR